jgi:3'(2'), 5'-bisphosphate nucleotidase
MYETELEVAIELAREAGAEILKRYNTPIKVENKVYEDKYEEPVTEADHAANELIVSALRREFPADGVLAEESTDDVARLEKRRVWMVDPIDGTKGFIERDGDFAVQIGLTVEGEAVLGVVYQPFHRVLYRATEGGGTWIETADAGPQLARVSDNSNLSEMILAASRSHRSPRMTQVVQALNVKEEIQRGSVGVKVGLIASQDCDLYVHLSPRTKQWDTCAPEIILREAGGEFTDLFGRRLKYNAADTQNRNGIVASNGAVHKQIIELLAPLLAEFGRAPV